METAEDVRRMLPIVKVEVGPLIEREMEVA